MSEPNPRRSSRPWGWLLPTALAVMVANVAVHILYMVVYSYLVRPGQPEAHYTEHAQLTGPYSSIIAGLPLMFLAARWLARKFEPALRMRAALLVWLVYTTLDVTIIVLAGADSSFAGIVTVSAAAKLLGAWLGGRSALRHPTAA